MGVFFLKNNDCCGRVPLSVGGTSLAGVLDAIGKQMEQASNRAALLQGLGLSAWPQVPALVSRHERLGSGCGS